MNVAGSFTLLENENNLLTDTEVFGGGAAKIFKHPKN